MQVMIEDYLGTELLTQEDRIDSRDLPPSLPDAYGLDIVNIIST